MVEGENATFTLTRTTGPLDEELTVRALTQEPDHPEATDNSNPTKAIQYVVFSAGSATATLTAPADDDDVSEVTDSLEAQILPWNNAPVDYEIGDPSQVTITITDRVAVVTVTGPETASVAEGAEVNFTLTRAGPIREALAVNVSVSDPGSFLGGDSWDPPPILPTTAEFQVDSDTATVSLQTKDDRRDIPDGEITLSVLSGTGYEVTGDGSASVTVTDDDVAPQLELIARKTTATEGQVTKFTLRRHGDTSNSVRAPVGFGPQGQPLEGVGELHFIGEGETEITISYTPEDNFVQEADRTFQAAILPLTGPYPGITESQYWTVLGDRAVSFTVADNPMPAVGVVPVFESRDEGEQVTFRFSRETPLTEGLDVEVAVKEETDVLPVGVLRALIVHFLPGEETKEITFATVGSDRDEDDGSLAVEILPGEDYRIDQRSPTAFTVIVDTDPVPTLRVADAKSVDEGDGSITLRAGFTANETPGRTASVRFRTIDGTATASSGDYETRHGTKVTLGGFLLVNDQKILQRDVGMLVRTPGDDNEAEGDETFTIQLYDPVNLLLPNGEDTFDITVTIEDNDVPTITVTADLASVSEGEQVSFTLTRTGFLDEQVTVDTLTESTGPFLGDLPLIIFFRAGDATRAFTGMTIDDARDTDNGVVTMTVLPLGTGYRVGNPGSASIVVRDNDGTSVLELSSNKKEVDEGDTVTFTLRRTGDTSHSIPVPISIAPEGQTAPEWYVIEAGDTEVIIPFTPEDNNQDELDRDYEATILPLLGVDPLHPDVDPMAHESEYWTVTGDRTIPFTIKDDDLPILWITPARSTIEEGETAGFYIHLDGLTQGLPDVVVDLSQTTHVLPADSPTAVHTGFGEGETTIYISQPTASDDGDEHEGALTAQIRTSENYDRAPEMKSAVITVLDLDPTPILEIRDARASEEDGVIDFTVALADGVASRKTVAVDYSTQDGTAAAGSDYAYTSGALVFQPGETSRNISVALINDTLAEVEKTFTVTLNNPTNVDMLDGQTSIVATGTIEDDEQVVSVEADQDSIVEGEGAFFTFTRRGNLENELTLTLTVEHAGIGPPQYGTGLPEVTFLANESQAGWSYATPDDDEKEPSGLISVTIQTPASLGLPETYRVDVGAAGTIVHDDDLPRVIIEAVHGHRTEGQDVEFNLTRSDDPSAELTVNLSVTGGDDFITSELPTSMTFPAWVSRVVITLETENDLELDGDGADTVVAEITEHSSYNIGHPGSARVAIFDSTLEFPQVSIAGNEPWVDEGEDVVFTLTRPEAGLGAFLNVQIQLVETSFDTSFFGETHSLNNKVTNVEVAFEAGSRTTTLTVPTVDEALNDGNSTVRATILAGRYIIQPHSGRAHTWVRDDDIPNVTVAPVSDEFVEDGVSVPEYTFRRTGDTSHELPLRSRSYAIIWRPNDAIIRGVIEYEGKIIGGLYHPELIIPEGSEGSFLPHETAGSNHVFTRLLEGESSRDYGSYPRFVTPLGGFIFLRLDPGYCATVPGDCEYRPQYHLGTPIEGKITVHNSFQGVRVEADRDSITEGEDITFTLHRIGGTPFFRKTLVNVLVQVTQNGEFIQGATPGIVYFDGQHPESTVPVEPVYSVTVTIPTTDDSLHEADGDITFTILPPGEYVDDLYQYEPASEGLGSDWSHTVTVAVADNDDPTAMSISDALADEEDGAIEFMVTVSQSLSEISVDWETGLLEGEGAAATPGEDYEAAHGTLTIAPGETSGTIRITLLDDDVREHRESFTLRLSNPSGTMLEDPSAEGTIGDGDLLQSVAIRAVSSEVEEGQDVVFEVERHTVILDGSDPPTFEQETERGALTINLDVSQQGDFISGPAPATVTFEAGSFIATVTVPTDDDQEVEADGSVSGEVPDDGTPAYQAPPSPATVAVKDNDFPVAMADVEEGEEEGEIVFIIRLATPAPRSVTVEAATVDGTATSAGIITTNDFGADFKAKTERLTFAVGDQEKQFSVSLVDDRFDEEDIETFTVELRDISDPLVKYATATGRIKDDEEPRTVSVIGRPEWLQLVIETLGAHEENLPYPVYLQFYVSSGDTIATERETTIRWVATPGSATAGEDYAVIGSSLTPPGIEAPLREAPEIVIHGGALVLPPGYDVGYPVIRMVDDEIFEELRETFTVEIVGVENLLVDPFAQQFAYVIEDNEQLRLSVRPEAEQVVEGEDAVFKVKISQTVPATTTVKYWLAGTAARGEDYTPPEDYIDINNPGTITIPPGERSAYLTIPVLADGLHDPDETLRINMMSSESRSLGRGLYGNQHTLRATVTILEEGTLLASVEEAEANEGEALEFTVNLTLATDAPVQVNWSTPATTDDASQNDTATVGVDYQPASGAVTIAAGSTSNTFTVATNEDTLSEGNEQFQVTLTGATRDSESVPLGFSSALGTIIDDDDPPTAVGLLSVPDIVNEDLAETNLQLVATLLVDGEPSEAALPVDTVVLVAFADGTATAGEDYSAEGGTVTIPAGEGSSNGILIPITLVDDLHAEGDETFRIEGTIVGRAGGLVVIPAEVTITDNDSPPTAATLTVTPGEVSEEAGATVFLVTAAFSDGSPRSVDTPITLSVEGAVLTGEDGNPTNAAAATDFTVDEVTLTIPAGEMDAIATLTLTPADDAMAEGDETLLVDGTADNLTITPAPLAILDNDHEPTGIDLSVAPLEVYEGDGAAVLQMTATLVGGGALTEDTPVSLGVHDVTAIAGKDYVAPSDVTLTIPAGSLTGAETLTLTVMDDDLHEGTEQLAVRGSNTIPGLPVAGVRVSIADDDASPTGIALSLDQNQVREDAGLQRLTVTATLVGGSKRTVDTPVTLSASHLTTSDADYSLLSIELLISSR